MASAKKCDRCGAYYQNANNKSKPVSTLLYTVYDLCPKCMAELEGWLRSEDYEYLRYSDGTYYVCPNCHTKVDNTLDKYCSNCGQRIKEWLGGKKNEEN